MYGKEQKKIASKIPDIIKTRHGFQIYSYLTVSLNFGYEAENMFSYQRNKPRNETPTK